MTMSDRGIHPDLIEEETAAEPVAEPAPPPTGDAGASAATPEAPSEPPEWLAQARASEDPKEILRILTKNLPKDDLTKNDTLAGILGDLADKRARALLQEREHQAAERERVEAYRRGDLYALGQIAQQDMAAQQQVVQQAAEVETSPFMEGVRLFQQTLPPEVQKEVQGKTYAPEGSPAEGLAAYLRAVAEAAIKHGFDDEIKRREPALRKAYLSETNGQAPTPELESGQPQRVREITDEQLSRMSLEESDQYLDERGQPRPGVKLRLTRGIPIQTR
jgi:hypothetical protein